MSEILIVGGGIAAFKALHRIQERAPGCKVTMISEEGTAACERPMLSKEFLRDTGGLRRTGVHFEGSDAVRIIQTRAQSIDRAAHRVLTTCGRSIFYDRMILATGSRNRRLPSEMDPDVLVRYLRTERDAILLRAELAEARHVAIIGGGFIGLEVAAAARSRGVKVTVIEAMPTLLSRVAPSEISSLLAQVHRENGVQIVAGASVLAVSRSDIGAIEVKTCTDTIKSDCVLAGIGVVPNVELAAECGLAIENGIVVDEHCQTSDADIFAAGEVTNYPVGALGLRTRSESWTVAADQGLVAADSALAQPGQGYREIPWLWSDQYDLNIQYLGLPVKAHRWTHHDGKREGAIVSIGWTAERNFLGAIGLNANQEIAELRRQQRKGLPMPERYLLKIAD